MYTATVAAARKRVSSAVPRHDFAPLIGGCLIAVVVAALGQYLYMAISIMQVSPKVDEVRRSFPAAGIKPVLPAAPLTVLTRAVAAAPLDQSLVNALFVARSVKEPPAVVRREAAIVGRLGWRSNGALQSLLAQATVDGNVPAIVSVCEALLMQNRAVDQATAVLNALEAQAETWPYVFRPIAARAKWRPAYLARVNQLVTAELLNGRLRTLSVLQQRGDLPQRDELNPFLVKLSEAGFVSVAEQLWRQSHPASRGPLHDVGLVQAYNGQKNQIAPSQFDWSIGQGDSFTVEIREKNGRYMADIAWDGHGLPVFMGQRTSAVPGRYRLRLSNVESDARLLDIVSFRLRCGDDAVPFDQVVLARGNQMIVETQEPLRCEFPFFDVGGNSTLAGRPAHVVFAIAGFERIDA